MKVLIQCNVCKRSWWVKGTSPGPNEYCAHEEAEIPEDEICEHLTSDFSKHTPIDCNW